MGNIPIRDAWTHEIHLVDVDASIGHVLIHFLHTGVYQTLNDEDIEGAGYNHKTLVRNEFQTAVLALEAAKKYSVPGLQELAQVELERRGREICLRDAVRAIREESIAGTSDENAWLRDFVSKKVRWTFEHDRPILSAPELFGNIESPTLVRLLAQVIISLYSEEVDKLRKGKTATDKKSTPEKKEDDDLWRILGFGRNAKNQEKKNKGVFEEEHLSPEPEPEPELVVDEPSPAKEDDPWGCGWEKLAPEPESVPEPQLKPEPSKMEVDRYAGLSKSQAKKLKAKLDKEAKLKEEEDAKRQKEEEEVAEMMQREEEEAAKIMQREEEEAELIRLEEEEAAATAGAGVSSLDSAMETGATSKDDDCELRLEHLFRDNRWWDCKPCELYMQKAALKSYLVGLPNGNELSTSNG